MITPQHPRLMAAYNKWQNESIYGAAATLGDDDRKRDRGAFFGSIHGTLSHLLWGDRMWLSRFTLSAAPEIGVKDSPRYIEEWDALRAAREETDEQFLTWTAAMTDDDLDGDLTWISGAAKREITLPRWLLITHIFNHQTHHRGQVHAMLTAAGATPAATDIPFLPGLLPA